MAQRAAKGKGKPKGGKAGGDDGDAAPIVAKPRCLEDDEDDWEAWTQAWVRLAQHAMSLGEPKTAQKCASRAVAVLPDSEKKRRWIPPRVWRWLSLGESLWGQGIEALVDPRRQERNVQDELRGAALTHLTLAAAYGRRAGIPRLVDACLGAVAEHILRLWLA